MSQCVLWQPESKPKTKSKQAQGEEKAIFSAAYVWSGQSWSWVSPVTADPGSVLDGHTHKSACSLERSLLLGVRLSRWRAGGLRHLRSWHRQHGEGDQMSRTVTHCPTSDIAGTLWTLILPRPTAMSSAVEERERNKDDPRLGEALWLMCEWIPSERVPCLSYGDTLTHCVGLAASQWQRWSQLKSLILDDGSDVSGIHGEPSRTESRGPYICPIKATVGVMLKRKLKEKKVTFAEKDGLWLGSYFHLTVFYVLSPCAYCVLTVAACHRNTVSLHMLTTHSVLQQTSERHSLRSGTSLLWLWMWILGV